MQIITRKTAQEPRKIERGRIKEQFLANMPWDAESRDVACSDRPTEAPKSNETVVEKERVREGRVGGRSRLSDGQFRHVSFTLHWGLLGFLTLCVRTSGGSVVRGVFGSVKAAAHQGELLHNVFHSALVHSLPERKNKNKCFFILRWCVFWERVHEDLSCRDVKYRANWHYIRGAVLLLVTET